MNNPLSEHLRLLGYELEGVLTDIKETGFDDVCLNTIKNVRDQLAKLAPVLVVSELDQAQEWYEKDRFEVWAAERDIDLSTESCNGKSVYISEATDQACSAWCDRAAMAATQLSMIEVPVVVDFKSTEFQYRIKIQQALHEAGAPLCYEDKRLMSAPERIKWLGERIKAKD